MLKWLLLGLLLLCLELLLIVILLDDHAVLDAMATERDLTRRWLGSARAVQLADQAQDWFNTHFVHPGWVAVSYNAAIPNAAARRRAGELGEMGGNSLFPYVQGRLHVLWDTVRQLGYRLALLRFWLLYLTPLAPAVILDGWLRRRVKLAQFGNCSPAIHRYSLYGLLALLYGLVLSLLLPWSLPPGVLLALPAGMLLCIGGLLANTPARV